MKLLEERKKKKGRNRSEEEADGPRGNRNYSRETNKGIEKEKGTGEGRSAE
jgi:hypothetical protein